MLNATAFWRRMQHPIAHDAAGELWVLGTSATDRSSALKSLAAPDFALPDLAGRYARSPSSAGKRSRLRPGPPGEAAELDLPVWQSLHASLQESAILPL